MMVKKIFGLGLLMLAAISVKADNVTINATNFPDDVFRGYVSQWFDTNSDGTLSDDEIAAATSLAYSHTLYKKGIKSLIGIEHLTALNQLVCSENDIRILDLSANKALTRLYCDCNNMTSLLLSDEAKFNLLEFYENNLRGEAVDRLIESMPQNTEHIALTFMYSGNDKEGNKLTLAQKQRLADKGWKAYDGSDGLHDGFNLEVVELNAANFPDNVFRSYVAANFDSNHDGLLSYDELQAVTTVEVGNMGISSLKGIENFAALETLRCWTDNLTELDLSSNTKLKVLNCWGSHISMLKLPESGELVQLVCYYNQLTEIDVSRFTKLERLTIYGNQLETLDVSNNKELNYLYCNDNKLTSLDVTGLSKLREVRVYNNNFSSQAFLQFAKSLPTVASGTLLVKANTGDANVVSQLAVNVATMKGWNVQNNNGNAYAGIEVPHVAINATNFPDEAFRNFVSERYDTNGNGYFSEEELAAVTTLTLTALSNLKSVKGIEHFSLLTSLICHGAKLTELDLSGNPLLTYVDCSSNQLKSLNVTACTKLEDLTCSFNQLTSLDVSCNPCLESLIANNNALTDIDLTKNTELEQLQLTYNNLQTLNLMKNTKLEFLIIYGNPMSGTLLDKFVFLLPQIEQSGYLIVINKQDATNIVMSRAHVKLASQKGWTVVWYTDSGTGFSYDGEPGITPVATGLRGDINEDGAVGIGDIVAITNIMAGQDSGPAAYLACPDDHHPHLIDLGLPSGLKWACCNVGADTPEAYGNYYAWGETTPKDIYSWDNYEYGRYNYYDDSDDGSQLVDIGRVISGTAFDAATMNWGAAWRTPNYFEGLELRWNTTQEWTMQNGVSGMKITGKNGGSIFIPATGQYDPYGSIFYAEGTIAEFWTSTFSPPANAYTWFMRDDYSRMKPNGSFIMSGIPVRAVRAE